MTMSAMQIIGNLMFSSSYDLVIDQTQSGYIYFGITRCLGNGIQTGTDEKKWAIARLKVTNSNQLNFFRWANGGGLQFDQVWNSNGNDDVYNGTATF